MRDEIVTTVDLLRHGEPVGGIRYRGSLDDPLSETGWAQMRAAVGEHCPWDAIVSSPLRRCVEFSRELCARRALALEVEPGFREIGFGEWEGHTAAEILTDSPQALTRFWRDPVKHPPPGGEPLDDCNHRVALAWRNLLERHSGHHLLLVVHGGVIRLVLRQVLEIPLERLWRLSVPYASFSRIRVYGRGAGAEPLVQFHGKGLE